MLLNTFSAQVSWVDLELAWSMCLQLFQWISTLKPKEKLQLVIFHQSSVWCIFVLFIKFFLLIGIAVCGSGFGAFLISTMFSQLVQKFGFDLTFCLYTKAGLCLLCTISGLIMKPISTKELRFIRMIKHSLL